MRSWKRWAGSGLAVVVVAAGLSAVDGGARRRRGEQHDVPAERAEEGVEAGRDHDVALDDRVHNETTLQKLTDTFNSSQTDVKVKLVNQIDWEATFTEVQGRSRAPVTCPTSCSCRRPISSR